MGLSKLLAAVLAHDEGLVLIPFGFTINGTTTPDGVVGLDVSTVSREEAGEFNVTLVDIPAACLFAVAGVSNTADDVDMYARCDWSTVATDGILKVRAQTGATQTDPTDNLLVGGFLVCRKTSR
jgi:hypothetical protein